MNLSFVRKQVCGRERYYPTNEAAEILVWKIAERLCLSRSALESLMALGLTVVVTVETETKGRVS